ncbi:MAG: LysR family transcriptional regulator [Verrucomicrobiota bacterium]
MELMELRHLRYFAMAAEEANVSRAAARLNVSQPAVSRQIRDLEEELGVGLFERQRLGLSLTPAGQTALAHAKEVLRQASAMAGAMKPFRAEGERVTVKVSYLPTALPVFLAEGLRSYNREYENVCVQIFEMTPADQAEALRKGEVDLALIGHASPDLKKEFAVEVLRKTPMVVALPDEHRLAKRKAIDLSELKGESFVSLSERKFPTRKEMTKTLFGKVEYTPNIVFEANGLSELLGLVGGGMGVAIVPRDLTELPHPRVVFAKLRRPSHSLNFAAAWRKEEPLEEIGNLVRLLKG